MQTKIRKIFGIPFKILTIVTIFTSFSNPAQALIVFEGDYIQLGDQIDASDQDVPLRFGAINFETITWNVTDDLFEFSNDISLAQNEIRDFAVQNLASAPGTPVLGQLFFNTSTNLLNVWNGSAWVALTSGGGGGGGPHAASHVDGTDDIQLATPTQKGLMSAAYAQTLEDLDNQIDEIDLNTINRSLTLGENVVAGTAYLTYENPADTSFLANIESTEFTISNNTSPGIALTAGTDTNPVLNYVYVREDVGPTAYVEASTTDPATQSFNFIPIAEVLLGDVAGVNATYYYIENLTNFVKNFIRDVNRRLRFEDVLWLNGVNFSNTGLEISTTAGEIMHIHELINYPAKNTAGSDLLTDQFYNTYGLLDNVNYDDGVGGNTAIGTNKFHKLLIWGDVYGGLHMERQREPLTSEYTSLEDAEADPDQVAPSGVPSQWKTVGFPIAHVILKQGVADVQKVIDLRKSGGAGGSVGGHSQNSDTGTSSLAFTLDLNNTGSGNNVDFIANQGTDNDGVIRYNASTNRWEISNDGGPFQAISTGTSASSDGWHGSATTIKVLPSDFITDDFDDNAVLDDNGRYVVASSPTVDLRATIAVPTGYRATDVIVYGSDTGNPITVRANEINDGTTDTSLGTGNVGTSIDITDFDSSATNYLSIAVETGNNDQIYGGFVTITEIP